MIKFLRHTLAFVLLCVAWAAKAQVQMRTSVDKDHILIGEHITLAAEARVPLGEPTKWFRLDTLAHFDILDSTSLQIDDDIDGKRYHQQWTITSFDSGRWQIPRLSVYVGTRSYASDTLPIQVAYAPYDLSQDYHEIKDIEPVRVPAFNYIPWALAAVALALLTIILIYFLRKKPKPVPVQPPLHPFEQAMKALAGLKRHGWQYNGEVKWYYTRLNDILRLFVLQKLGVATLERTNDELIAQLKGYNLTHGEYNDLVEALHMADFVKFAQFEPQPADNEKSYSVVQSAITSLNAISKP